MTSAAHLSTTRPRIAVVPKRALIDERVQIRLSGFEPHHAVTIRAQMQDDITRLWKSHAAFRADDQGRVDLTTQQPLTGTYDDVDPMGLFYSMILDDTEEISPFVKMGLSPAIMSFAAEVDGQPLASTTLERLFVAPEVTRESVRDHGLAGMLFQPVGPGLHPGAIVLGGSEGGLKWSQDAAALLASHGYAALALAYFTFEHLPAFEHLPSALVNIPLEYFETAIRWLQMREVVMDDRLAVIGRSRGGELALLLGATFPQITTVVSYVPSSVIFGGVGGEGDEQAAWTHRGTPLPFLRNCHTPAEQDEIFSQEPIPLAPHFLRLLANPSAVEAVAIPAERTQGPILLISGQDDQMWPSSMMSDMVITRLKQHRYPYPYKHLRYTGAGHYIPFPYLPTTVSQLRHPVDRMVYALGGNAKGQAVAQADSWAQVLTFLGESLGW